MPALPDLEKEANRLLQAGSNMAALRVAEQAAKEHASSAAAHHLLACILERTTRAAEALRSYRECLRLGGHSDAADRVAVLQAALERPAAVPVPTHLRSWHSALPFAALTSIQNALHNFSYKGTPLQKSPFDHALYPMLLWQLKPRTIIEIGSKEGGSALWMGDLCDTFRLDCEIHSIDIVRVASVKHKRVTFHEGDGRNLGGTLTEKMLKRLPRPWLVIEDADHSYETTHAVLEFFGDLLTPRDMLVVEDGIITDLSQMAEGASGPHRALRKFLQRNYAEWELLPEWCDFFGYNFTWSSNGFLRRTGLKKLSLDVAPERPEALAKIKAKDFAGALETLAAKPISYGSDYLRAYALWRLDRLPEAQRAAIAEGLRHPEHKQAVALADLLTSKLEGNLQQVPATAVARRPVPAAGEPLPMLNLGCGRRHHPAWLNFDVVPTHESVQAHDLQQPLPLHDGTASVVYHSHVLEHLPRDKAATFIAECHRVLATGGILRIAVPDLEGAARAYLRELDAAANGDASAQPRHEWMTHELVDQLARHRSGGEMLAYWKQHPMPAEDFVLARMGREVGDFIAEYRGQTSASSSSKPLPLNANTVGSFRLGGEVHQWMYDRVSLAKLLTSVGFVEPRVCRADESAITDFASYQLDTDEHGHVRKPDSLFMEARKA